MSVPPGAATLRAVSPIEVDDPATGEVIGSVPDTTAAAVHEAAERARRAQPGWEQLGFHGRARCFREARRWMLEHQAQILASIVAENGKSDEDAVVELAYCVTAFAYWARTAERHLRSRRVRSFSPFIPGRSMYTRREALGVVGVIGPWNNPLINSFGDAIPALAAGNAVLLKPSEHTPLTALMMQKMAAECGWPADVFQVVTGARVAGEALVDAVDFVMFTGSTRTGRAVAARAAARLIPCSLELGGKDALIVLADAPLERAVNVAVHGALFNAGQVCTSVERVYVEAALYDQFVTQAAARIAQLRTGASHGLGSTDIGAITVPAQIDIIEEHLRDARDRGARVLSGGVVTRAPGRFVEPTLLVDVDHSMRCMREETFGPTLPVMKVADAAQAIDLANDSEYGLQATIVTRDVRRARRLAARLRVGVVTVNDSQSNYMALGLPMGGWKNSGLGVRHGAEGIRKYTRLQAVAVNAHPMRRDPHMMPFRPAGYRLMIRVLKALYTPRTRARHTPKDAR